MRTHFIEPLEPRQLLSITWANRGKSDRFDTFYGTHAATARQNVDAAIADWNRAMPGPVNLRLNISAADLPGPALGSTSGTTIHLDRDGARRGWVFDPDIANAPAYPDRHGVAELVSLVADSTDFYTVVAHEIGHALGFFDPAAKRDRSHAKATTDLMAPSLNIGIRRFISPYDVQHTKTWQSLTRATRFTTSATSGAPQLAVGWTDFYPGRGYAVYRSDRPGPDHTTAGATLVATTKPGVTAYLDPAAESGRTYYYFVAPVAAKAKGKKAMANAAAEATASGSRDDHAAPLTVQATADLPRVTLTWTPVAGARYYSVYAYLGPGARKPALAAVLPASQTTWTDPASANGAYEYAVSAGFSPAGTGPAIDFPHHATGLAVDPTRLAASSVTVAYDDRDSDFPILQWPEANDADGQRVAHFRVYRAVDTGVTDRAAAGATLLAADVVPFSDLRGDWHGAYIDPTGAAGVTYRYWVLAVVPAGAGSSDTVELPVGRSVAATRPVYTYDPGTVRVTRDPSDPTGNLHITWDPIPGADQYVVYITSPEYPAADYQAGYHYHTAPEGSTSAIWGFAWRSRIWVEADFISSGRTPVLVGSALGTKANDPAPTADVSGISLQPNGSNPSPAGTLVFRTESPGDLADAADLTFVGQIDGRKQTFLDPSTLPGHTYYYWTFSYYSPGGSSVWQLGLFGPAARP